MDGGETEWGWERDGFCGEHSPLQKDGRTGRVPPLLRNAETKSEKPMQWYYAAGQEQKGPVSTEELLELARTGAVTASTLIWKEGMAEWKNVREVAAGEAALASIELRSSISLTNKPAAVAEGQAACVECGRAFALGDLADFGGQRVCVECKPRFVQRLQEGVSAGEMAYAGFWIRVGAYLIDYIIMNAPQWVLGFAVGTLNPATLSPQPGQMPPPEFFAMQAGFMLLGFGIYFGYQTFFVGKYGATPGKMILKLRVVRSDGERLTYGRAFGRAAAQIVSSLICGIGYMMAGWDEEKRALHDRMCDTRVVRR